MWDGRRIARLAQRAGGEHHDLRIRVVERAQQGGDAAPPALAERFQRGVAPHRIVGGDEADQPIGVGVLGRLLDRALPL